MTDNQHQAETLLHPVTTGKLYADELCEDAAQLHRLRTFLESYQIAVRMLRLCREDGRARAEQSEYFGIRDDECGELGGKPEEWLSKIKEVRAFVESLPNRPAKMMLYYHYIRNLSVERAAEELDISRRAAFRLKKKALAFAAARLPQWLSGQDPSYGHQYPC